MAALPNIIMFSPLPPRKNGIADYCWELLGPLSRVTNCTVVVDDGTLRAEAPTGVLVLEATEYCGRAAAFAPALHVYQMGNNRDHVYMLPFVARKPGLLVLHDPTLHHLLECATLGDVESYCQALEAEYAAPGHVLANQFRQHRLRDTRMFFDLPMLGGLVGPARGVIVHSRYAAMKVLARVPEAVVHVVPHLFRPVIRGRGSPRAATRARLGLAEHHLVLLSMGFVTRAKRIEDVLSALAQVRQQMPPFHYIIAGEWRPEEVDLPTLVTRLGLQDRVTVLGYVTDEEFSALLGAADLVVNLRHPIGGETSGTVIRALGTGACAVVVDRGAFAEIPDDAAVKLRWGADIRTRLAKELLALAREPARRAQIGKAAAAWIRSHNSPERTVAGYLEAIRQTAITPAPKMRSTAQWEIPPQCELTRLIRAVDTKPERLPLWFRGGIIPGSTAPCRVLLLGGSADDAELLAQVGHLQPAMGEVSTAVLAEIAPRTLDLVLLVAAMDELPDDAKPLLQRLNRILGFGGILAIDVRRRSGAVIAHPLERQIDGTALLRSCGFAVDCTTVASPVGLPSDMISVLDGRAWRTTKVGEFGIGRIPALRRDPLAVGATA
jgi:glycosyltransferase involved in cell wall biosynthesis